MGYKLIGENEYYEPSKQVFKNRGIEKVDSFINPSEEDVIHWSKLRNIKEAINNLLRHVKNNSNIFIQVDSDVDGLCSSTILIDYLQNAFDNVNIQWRLQDGKEHGVFIDTIPSETNLVILPDSGSGQYEEHRILKEKGIDVIVLDHHECTYESEDAIVVNNQLSPDYPNKDFAGAGIVLKFCEGLDEELNLTLSDRYWDLVALGNIADVIDLKSPETRYYCMEGLKRINNPFLKEITEKQSFSMGDKINFVTIGFFVAPLLNSVIRVGEMDDKIDVMKCLLDVKEERYYKRNDVNEPISTFTIRKMGNLRNKQNRERDKFLEIIDEEISSNSLNSNKIIVVKLKENKKYKNIGGLVANQLRSKYKKPILILSKNEDTLKGSARGYEDLVDDLKEYMSNTGLFEYCEGHPNALGVSIKEENIQKFIDYSNENLKAVEDSSDEIDVDFVIPFDELQPFMIKEIAQYEDLWGNSTKEPVVVIKDVSVNTSEIDMLGKYKNTLKFKLNEIAFVKKYVKKEEKEELLSEESLFVDLIGSFKINEWNGNEEPQLLIKEMLVKESFMF